MAKDLSNTARAKTAQAAAELVAELNANGESLAIAREAMIDAFDKAASNNG